MRKSEILVAAEQLFQHYGFAKTTVADIARVAGIGVGSVYLEFSSKDSISSALCQENRDKVLKAMRAVLASDGNYSERLVQVLEARVLGLQGSVGAGLHGDDVVYAACAATRRVNERFDAAESTLLQGFLEEGNAVGAFTVADAPTTAKILLQVYESICLPPTKLDAAHAQDGREILTTLHALVLGGVLSRNV
jgi:AcrR family transcriptional regulator